MSFINASDRLRGRKRFGESIGTVTVSDFAYYCALAIWIVFCMLNMSFFAQQLVGVITYIRIICLAMVLLGELDRIRVSIQSLLGLCLCSILVLIALHVEQRLLVDALVFIWGARDRNIKTIMMTAIISMTACLVLVIASSYAGIIPNYYHISTEGRTRTYLGFRYALYPSAALFGITCASLLLVSRRHYPAIALGLLLANWYIFSRTDSRLSFFTGIVSIILVGLYYSSAARVFHNRCFKALACSGFTLCAAISLTLTVLYDPSNGMFQEINTLFGGRLQFGHTGFERYGISLLGIPLSGDTVGNGLNIYGERAAGEYFYIDCIYVRMLIEDGVLFFAAYLAAMTFVVVHAFKTGDTKLAIILLCLAAHGIVDDLMLNLFYNPFLLLIGVAFSELYSSIALYGNSADSKISQRKAGIDAVHTKQATALSRSDIGLIN